MLKSLRKKGVAKKILWVIAVLIILSFGLWGQSNQVSSLGPGRFAGRIFGKKISLEEYAFNLHQSQIQAIIHYGQNFNRIKQFLNLEAEAWDRIILLQEARKRGIKISDQDVVKTVESYEFFQREGQFDKLLYNDLLRFVFRIQARDFEEGVRDALKLARLYEQETENLTVPDQEIFDAYKQSHEKIQVSYILFTNDDFKNQVTEDEARARDYYQTHQNDFLNPPMVNVEYIRFDFPAQPDPADLSEKKTEDGNAAAGATATEAQKDETARKAIEVYRELTATPAFAQIAAKNNLKIEESGFFSMEQPNLKAGWSYPVIQKIFQLKAGEVSEPIATDEGYQILKIKEAKPAFMPEYREIQSKVMEAWKTSEAAQLAKQNAGEILKKVRETAANFKRPDFGQIAKDMGLEVAQTPAFSRGEYLPKIGISKDFQEAAFALNEENSISNVVEAGKGYAILHRDATTPVDMKEFEKQKEEFAEDLLIEKKNKAFSDFLTHLRLKANLQIEEETGKTAAQD